MRDSTLLNFRDSIYLRLLQSLPIYLKGEIHNKDGNGMRKKREARKIKINNEEREREKFKEKIMMECDILER